MAKIQTNTHQQFWKVDEMKDFFELAQNVQNNDENVCVTENGAIGYRTSEKALMDLNFSVTSLRNAPNYTILEKWLKAFDEDHELAMRWLFFLRDAREGLGERNSFRVILGNLALTQPEMVKKLLRSEDALIAFYGRWDDILHLIEIDTVRKDVYALIKRQLDQDLANMEAGKPISLLSKWLPSVTASKRTYGVARKVAKGIGMRETEYRKTLSKLRSYLKIVEKQMSSQQWDQIDYSSVPSKANLTYANAFMRHDPERRTQFLSKAKSGEVKMNSSVAFPYEIVHKINSRMYSDDMDDLEAMWMNLPKCCS
jgi:hypothetical protein